ncbi:hypothetical protein RRF57_000076 [Xylaria bambusicola]|uniref:Uncharacterized protein n=1 Tax=Xylaria bambusicola TaxID=326684 RepID=A0AAN7U311_9PEZI
MGTLLGGEFLRRRVLLSSCHGTHDLVFILGLLTHGTLESNWFLRFLQVFDYFTGSNGNRLAVLLHTNYLSWTASGRNATDEFEGFRAMELFSG